MWKRQLRLRCHTVDSEPSQSWKCRDETCFYANQGEHPERRKYVDAVEGIEKVLKRMTFSARSKQTKLLHHAFTAVSAADQPASAGRPW
jgi:hypothetical protein